MQLLRNITGRIFMAALLGSFLLAVSGCGKKTDPPVSGQETDKTDKTAPKTIVSKEITGLRAGFFLATRWSGDEEHEFAFEIKNDEKDVLTAYEGRSGANAPADAALLEKLCAVIEKNGLAERNGLDRANYSLAPEYQKCSLSVNYASGEKLEFTDLGDPYALWEEEFYDVFAAWFAGKGAGSLYPEEDDSSVNYLRFSVQENGLFYEYRITDAAGGETRAFCRSVYDLDAKKNVSKDFFPVPDDYYETLTKILSAHETVRRYDFSAYNRAAGNYSSHDLGYYGWGSRGPGSGEEDSESASVSLHAGYESGNRFSIDTKKPSEIEGMRPLTGELRSYLDSIS